MWIRVRGENILFTRNKPKKERKVDNRITSSCIYKIEEVKVGKGLIIPVLYPIITYENEGRK